MCLLMFCLVLLLFFFFFFFVFFLFCYFFFFFFFSSRRRHTRLTCDWSSDVCSSDLSVAIRVSRMMCELIRFMGVVSADGIFENIFSAFTSATAEVHARSANEIGRASCRERV